jgi:hypothetical protein
MWWIEYGQSWWTPHHLTKEQMEEQEAQANLRVGVDQGLYDNKVCSLIICLLRLWLVWV